MPRISIRGADLAWVFKKGGGDPIGVNLRHQKWVRLDSGDYSVATFRLVDAKFQSAGQLYLRVEPGAPKLTFNGWLLVEPNSQWHDGNIIKTDVFVEGDGIIDVTMEYASAAKEAVAKSMEFVIKTSENNPALERKFGSNENHYSDLGFSRFSQRRDAHHGIMTVGSAGLPELECQHVGVDVWEQCCRVATMMAGFDPTVFYTLDREQRLNVLDNLACGALSVTGFMYQWNNEPSDSICCPCVVLGTMQDCEDNATSIVASFNWLMHNFMSVMDGCRSYISRMLLRHLHTMVDSMWMAAGYVDIKIANPEIDCPDSVSGHAFAIMVLKKTYRPAQERRVYIVEGTNYFYVSPAAHTIKESKRDVDRLFGGALHTSYADITSTYSAPTLQPIHRYKTVDVVFSPTQTFLVGHKDGDKFMVGLDISEFIRWKFEFHPTAPPTTIKKLHDRWGDFVLCPDLQKASELFHSFPELVGSYKLKKNVHYKSVVPLPGKTLYGISGWDLKKKYPDRLGFICATGIDMPFTTILLVSDQPPLPR